MFYLPQIHRFCVKLNGADFIASRLDSDDSFTRFPDTLLRLRLQSNDSGQTPRKNLCVSAPLR